MADRLALQISMYETAKASVVPKMDSIFAYGDKSREKYQDVINRYNAIDIEKPYDKADADSMAAQIVATNELKEILRIITRLETTEDTDVKIAIDEYLQQVDNLKATLSNANKDSRFNKDIVNSSDKLLIELDTIQSKLISTKALTSSETILNTIAAQLDDLIPKVNSIENKAKLIGTEKEIAVDVTINAESDIEILNIVSTESNELVRNIANNVQAIRSQIFNSFDEEGYGETTRYKDVLKAEIIRLKEDLTKIEMEDSFSNPKFNSNAQAARIDKTRRLIIKKEEDLRTFESKTKQNLNISVKSISAYTDLNLVAIRKFQAAIRKALKEFNDDKKNQVETKEWKAAIKAQVTKQIAAVFQKIKLSELTENIETFISTLQAKKINNRSDEQTLTSIKLLLNDNITQIRSSYSVILSDVRNGIKIKDDRTKFEKKAVVMIYVLKTLRVAVAWLAFYLADTLFKDYYIKQKYGKKETIVDLRWYVVIYASFQFVFDLIALVVMYFVRRIDPEVVSGALMLDYAFDAFIVTLMVLASSIWVADIIQDKRYFMYRTSTTRATRVLKTIMFWLLVIHSVTPYYYLAGPNFTGSANASMFDKKIKTDVTVKVEPSATKTTANA